MNQEELVRRLECAIREGGFEDAAETKACAYATLAFLRPNHHLIRELNAPTPTDHVLVALNKVRSLCFGAGVSTTDGLIKGEGNRVAMADALNALWDAHRYVIQRRGR